MTYVLAHLLCLAKANSQAASLIVSAVAARDELAESLRAWIPTLQIVLHSGSVVQLA